MKHSLTKVLYGVKLSSTTTCETGYSKEHHGNAHDQMTAWIMQHLNKPTERKPPCLRSAPFRSSFAYAPLTKLDIPRSLINQQVHRGEFHGRMTRVLNAMEQVSNSYLLAEYVRLTLLDLAGLPSGNCK